ncbi:MAG: LysR substrate-binding domain-containing protein [Aestuariivirga sp.]|uniref:LysR substrate-binding domain-containing protein n=1 Tax=Aestuariivirga sp. TaxID=2650926 RepID=UPI0038D10F3A
MKALPPLNFVRSFESAARHLSFTEAARELGYTQAAISGHIRALEQWIGQDLFHRETRGIRLTEVGEAFLPTLRQALKQIDNAARAVMTSRLNEAVVVSCPASLAQSWLADCLTMFSRQHPGIIVTVHGTIWEDLSERLSDITISHCRVGEAPPGAVQLWEDRLMLVCAPGHFKVPGKQQLAAALANARAIRLLGREDYWQCMLDALGFSETRLHMPVAVNMMHMALEYAARGAGITVAPRALASPYLERKQLVEPLQTRPLSPWAYYLLESRHAKSRSVGTVRRWILQQAERLQRVD